VPVFCNQSEAFTSDLGDDQSRYLFVRIKDVRFRWPLFDMEACECNHCDLRGASVAMDSPLSSPAKAEFPVCPPAAEEVGPCPRFVTNEELHVLQTCLTRWRTEVEQDIKGTVVVYLTFFVF